VSKFLGRDMAVALRWSNFPRSLKLTTHMEACIVPIHTGVLSGVVSHHVHLSLRWTISLSLMNEMLLKRVRYIVHAGTTNALSTDLGLHHR